MKANQADFPVRSLCHVLRVSASGYYDWRERAPSARALANAALMQRIGQAHQASDATYGAPRIHAELSEQGVVAGHNRIATASASPACSRAPSPTAATAPTTTSGSNSSATRC